MIIKIEDHLHAGGVRMAKLECIAMLRGEGAMYLPGWVILKLIAKIAAFDLALASVPADWAMTHSELCASRII